MNMVVVTQCHTNHHKLVHVLRIHTYTFLYSVYIPSLHVHPCTLCTGIFLYSVYILNSVHKDTTLPALSSFQLLRQFEVCLLLNMLFGSMP